MMWEGTNVMDRYGIRTHTLDQGTWWCRGRLGAREDARIRGLSIEHHSVDLLVEGTDLLLDVVDGMCLGDEIRHCCVNRWLPDRKLLSRLLDNLEALNESALQAINTRFHGLEAVSKLLHLIEQQLGVWVHGIQVLAGAGKVVVRLQHGSQNQISDTNLLTTVADWIGGEASR